jgi:hypothetical protein
MGDGRNFLKSYRASLFNDDLSSRLISAGSISLDSTFKGTAIGSRYEIFFRWPIKLNQYFLYICALVVINIFALLIVTYSKKRKTAPDPTTVNTELQPLHCKENHIFLFLFWELRGLSPNFHIHVSVSCEQLIHIFPWSVYIFPCSRIVRPIMEIYKSLTVSFSDDEFVIGPCRSTATHDNDRK